LVGAGGTGNGVTGLAAILVGAGGTGSGVTGLAAILVGAGGTGNGVTGLAAILVGAGGTGNGVTGLAAILVGAGGTGNGVTGLAATLVGAGGTGNGVTGLAAILVGAGGTGNGVTGLEANAWYERPKIAENRAIRITNRLDSMGDYTPDSKKLCTERVTQKGDYGYNKGNFYLSLWKVTANVSFLDRLARDFFRCFRAGTHDILIVTGLADSVEACAVIPQLRSQFNREYSPDKYATLIARLEERCGSKVNFRVAETPVFMEKSLLDQMADVGAELASRLIGDPPYIEAAHRAIPRDFCVPGEV